MYFTVYKLYPKQIEQKYYGNVGTGFESGTNFWIITMWPFKSYIYIKKNCANELGVVIPMLLMREELESLV